VAPKLTVDKTELFKHLQYEPHPGQLEVHNSWAPRRVLACGVRWGKSRAAAMEAVAAALEPRERSIGWVVAPTYDLAEKVFREIQYIVARYLRHRIISMRENEKRIVLRNLGGGESEIRAKSADNPVSLLGEGLDYVIVDEAARLKPAIWQGHISQRLLDRHGWALLISTPRGKGWFYDAWRRGQNGADPDYASWNFPSRTNPYLDEALIEAERGRLPERVFRQEYEGEFLEGAGAVFRQVRECATGQLSPPYQGHRYVAGLDLGKVEDFTVLVIMDAREQRVVFTDRFYRVDWALQIERIKLSVQRYNRAELYVDSTGAGEPILEAIREAGCNAQPYTFTARSKAALIDNLAIMLERRQVTLPRPDLWPEGIEELLAYEYDVSEGGNVRMSAPAGTHDDCVAALGLACWPLKPLPAIHFGRVIGGW
jgi:hypothetical protein